MIDPNAIPIAQVEWKGAVRIIRSAFPPIDLFEDIADPADWPLLISAGADYQIWVLLAVVGLTAACLLMLRHLPSGSRESLSERASWRSLGAFLPVLASGVFCFAFFDVVPGGIFLVGQVLKDQPCCEILIHHLPFRGSGLSRSAIRSSRS